MAHAGYHLSTDRYFVIQEHTAKKNTNDTLSFPF